MCLGCPECTEWSYPAPQTSLEYRMWNAYIKHYRERHGQQCLPPVNEQETLL